MVRRAIENKYVPGDILTSTIDEVIYSFDEGTGSIAYDSSENSNDGDLENMNSADWVTGISGKCLDFDGSYDYVAYYASNEWKVKNADIDTFGSFPVAANTPNYVYSIHMTATATLEIGELTE